MMERHDNDNDILVSGLPRATVPLGGALAMTATATTTETATAKAKAKWKTANGILETATLSLCSPLGNRPLPQGARERHDHNYDKSFISFWIATGYKEPSQ
jgi:hypothetical protein